jgi:hypothetical protein
MLEKEKKWSDPIDSSLNHEHFVAIPGYGDATFMIEKVKNYFYYFISQGKNQSKISNVVLDFNIDSKFYLDW